MVRGSSLSFLAANGPPPPPLIFINRVALTYFTHIAATLLKSVQFGTDYTRQREEKRAALPLSTLYGIAKKMGVL